MTPATILRLQSVAGYGEQLAQERLAAIQEARSEGHSMQEIADALGLSRQRVHQILTDAKGTQ